MSPINQYYSVQYFNGKIAQYIALADPVNIKSTSHDKRHLNKLFNLVFLNEII